MTLDKDIKYHKTREGMTVAGFWVHMLIFSMLGSPTLVQANRQHVVNNIHVMFYMYVWNIQHLSLYL